MQTMARHWLEKDLDGSVIIIYCYSLRGQQQLMETTAVPYSTTSAIVYTGIICATAV